jgi:hypothetical protein
MARDREKSDARRSFPQSHPPGRSVRDLGAEEPVKSKDREPLVDIPEGVLELLEAPSDTRPPARLLEPLKVVDEIRATPLLTPDEEGAIYELS